MGEKTNIPNLLIDSILSLFQQKWRQYNLTFTWLNVIEYGLSKLWKVITMFKQQSYSLFASPPPKKVDFTNVKVKLFLKVLPVKPRCTPLSPTLAKNIFKISTTFLTRGCKTTAATKEIGFHDKYLFEYAKYLHHWWEC